MQTLLNILKYNLMQEKDTILIQDVLFMKINYIVVQIFQLKEENIK